MSRKWIDHLVTVEETSTQVAAIFTRALDRERLLVAGLPITADGTLPITVDDVRRPILLAVSDNGPQMTSGSTREFMAMHAIAVHFGRPGTPTDQEPVECTSVDADAEHCGGGHGDDAVVGTARLAASEQGDEQVCWTHGDVGIVAQDRNRCDDLLRVRLRVWPPACARELNADAEHWDRDRCARNIVVFADCIETSVSGALQAAPSGRYSSSGRPVTGST